MLDFIEPEIAPFDPPTPKALEQNMEWIGCTVCEIFALKLHRNLETGVRGHSRSSKAALFDRAHTTLYSSSIVTICLYLLPFPRYSRIRYWSKIATPLYLAHPLGVKPSDLQNDPWRRQTRIMGLSESERISMMRSAVLTQSTRVTHRHTDRQTHRIGVAYTRYSIYAVARKNRLPQGTKYVRN